MINLKKIVLTTTTLAITSITSASDFSWHTDIGSAFTQFTSKTQQIQVTPDITNQYQNNASKDNDLLLGAGIGYQVTHSTVALNLGASMYYLRSQTSGVNHPFINGGDFDALNYSAEGHSFALMAEPKFVLTTYAWQPYLLTGLGVAINHFGDYSENKSDPASTAVPSKKPFNSKTETNCAYEVGVGIQHIVNISPQAAPIVALDYRFMNWGDASLSPYAGQPNNNSLALGELKTTVINLSISWPF